MKRRALTATLTALHEVNTLDDIDTILSGICKNYSLAHVAFLLIRHGINPLRFPLHLTTYPLLWQNQYIRNDYFEIDPVVVAGKASLLAFDWSELNWLSPAARKLRNEARAMDLGRHGLSIPIRGTQGERSLFSVTSNLSLAQWRRWQETTLGDLHILCQHVHNMVLTVSGLRASSIPRPLSRRELQCLQLLARGLISKQIASRLDISESAVRIYLRSARRKLRANTAYQAIAKAAFLEIIEA